MNRSERRGAKALQSGVLLRAPGAWCRVLVAALSGLCLAQISQVQTANQSAVSSTDPAVQGIRTPLRAAMALLALIFQMASACAGTIDITVMPKMVFWADGSTSNLTHYPSPWFESPDAAFAAAKTYEDSCQTGTSGSTVCYTSVNLRPAPHTSNPENYMNGVALRYVSDLEQCSANGCSTIAGSGAVEIYGGAACPAGVVGYNSLGGPTYFSAPQIAPADANGSHIVCSARIWFVEPCADCNARGNPIHPGTGQKLQVERDYTSVNGGLEFARTYRNTNGYFASLAIQGLIDSSVAGRISTACYPGTYSGDGTGISYSYCFPYAGYTPNGAQSYYLRGSTGRTTVFSGAPTAIVAASADVSISVTQQPNASGTFDWYVRKPDEGFEIYDTSGGLARKVSSDGRRDIRFVHSDAATPPSVAPRPGLVISMADAFGRSLGFTWDAAARMASMTDPVGSIYRYDYDPKANLSSVTYPDGSQRTYAYEATNINGGAPCLDSNGNAIPTPINALTGISDENGSRYATFKYGCKNLATSTEHAGGVDHYTFTYGSSTTGIDPLGTSRTFSYVELLSVKRPTSVRQPMPGTTGTVADATTYDANGNVASRDDFNGSRACYVSDLSRNLETTKVEGLSTSATCSSYTAAGATLPTGSRKTSTQWHPDWKLPVVVAEPGRLMTSVYNGQPDPFNGGATASCAPSTALLPDGKPIAVLCKQVEQATTDANGSQGFSGALPSGVANRVQQWTYNAYGQVLSETDPRNNTTTYAYYADTSFTGSDPNAVGHTQGDLQTVSNAKGQVTSYTQYDKHGNVLESVDPNGVVTSNSYDLRQRLLSTSVGGQTTSYSYDAAGQLLKVTAPYGSWVGYEYDAAHRQTAVKDNLGNRIEYVLDNAGNRTSQSAKDPSGALARTLARSIDALGRVQQTTGRE